MNGCDSCGGAHRGSTLDMRQRSQVSVHMPGNEGGGKSTGFPCHMIRYVAGVGPTAFEQRTEQGQGLRSGTRSPGGPASLAHGATQGCGKCSVWPGDTTARASGEGGRIARDRQGPQQVGVQDQRWRANAIRGSSVERAQGSDEKEVLLHRGLGLLDHQAIGRFQHHLACRIGGIVLGQRFAESIQ